MKIHWANPPQPEPRARWGQMPQFVAELQAHPGRWAIWPFTTTAPTSARNAAERLRKHGCDTQIADGVVYVRWPKP